MSLSFGLLSGAQTDSNWWSSTAHLIPATYSQTANSVFSQGDLKGYFRTDTTPHNESELDMSMSIRQLMDKITDSEVTSDMLVKMASDLEDNEVLSTEEITSLIEDFSVIRYNYTMDVLIKSIGMYLIRSKSCNGAALRDYKRALRILKFVIKETEELYDAEQKE